MHVAVIGGAGYIGSHVVREMLDAGHSVTVFDNLSHGLHENLFPDARFFHGDLHDRLAVREVLSTPVVADAVVHLAAVKAAGESMTKPEKYAYNNIAGTISVLNAMAETGVRRMVFSSSAAVYGMPEYLPLDEQHPTNPMNFYGFTKLEIERLLRWYDELKGIRFAALRYFNAAGYDPAGRVTGLEQDPANLLPIVMEVATGVRDRLDIYGNDYPTPDGTCIRDYIHVTDLAKGHVAALRYIESQNTSLTVNLGTGTGISVQEMVETARKVTGTRIPSRVTDRRPGDPAELTASSKRANTVLQWQAVHSSAEELVTTTWQAYRRNRAG